MIMSLKPYFADLEIRKFSILLIVLFQGCPSHPSREELNKQNVKMLNSLEIALSPPPGTYDHGVDIAISIVKEPSLGWVVIRVWDETLNQWISHPCSTRGGLWIGSCLEIKTTRSVKLRLDFDGSYESIDSEGRPDDSKTPLASSGAREFVYTINQT